MTKTELQVMSQGEAAYHRLYEAIRSGDFRPGDRLREIEVAEEVGPCLARPCVKPCASSKATGLSNIAPG